MSLNLPQIALSTAGITLLVFVLVMLIRRKLYSEFPALTAYVGFMVATTIGNEIVRFYSPVVGYYFAYWFQALGEASLALVVVFDIFRRMLGSYAGMQAVWKRTCLAACVFIVGFSIYMVLVAPHWDRPTHWGILVPIELERSTEFVRFSLIFLFFVFCRFFGLGWRHYAFGIVLGFATASAAEFLSHTIRIQFGMVAAHIHRSLGAFAYDSGTAIWCYYFASSESKVFAATAPMSPQLARWNAALDQLLAR